MAEPVVSVIVLDRSLVAADLVDVVLSALESRGFDVLGVLDCDGTEHRRALDAARYAVAPTPHPARAAIVVDVHPLRLGRSRSSRLSGRVANPRLGAVSSLDSLVRARWSELVPDLACQPPMERSLLSCWEAEEDQWAVVRRLEPEAEDDYRADVAERADWINPPFPVLVDFSGFAISCRTDLVTFEGTYAICRTFRAGRDKAFANELDCYGLSDDVEAISTPLAVGRNWIVVPYHHRHIPLQSAHGSRIPLDVARRSLRTYAEVSARGYGLLDFGPENVLIDSDGHLAVIDFEHMHRYLDSPPPLPASPLGMGASYFDAWRKEHGVRRAIAEDLAVLKTYDRHWRPRIGVPIGSLLQESDIRLRFRRRHAFSSQWLRRRATTSRLCYARRWSS